jgi:tetraacyldisaccharide-1-P 4'-kinase
LGIFGKTEKLPDEKTLEIVTQCGHALISAHLVKDVVRKIKRSKMTPEEGAKMLIRPCVCGIGNPKRMGELLTEMAAEK